MNRENHSVNYIFMRKNFLRRVLCVIICVLSVFSLFLPSFASKANAYKTVVTIGIPIIDAEKNKEEQRYVRYYKELMDSIAVEGDFEYTVVFDSWNTLLNQTKSGLIDILLECEYSAEREETLEFSKCVIGYETAYLYVDKFSKDCYFDDYNSFDGMRIGFIKGALCNSEFKVFSIEHDFRYEKVEYESVADLFSDLELGKIDACLNASFEINKNYKAVAQMARQPVYAVAAKTNNGALKRLDRAYTILERSNPFFLQEMNERYLSSQYEGVTPFLTRSDIVYLNSIKKVHVRFIDNGKPYYDGSDKKNGIQLDIINTLSNVLNIEFVEAAQDEKPDIYVGLSVLKNSEVNPEYYVTMPYYNSNRLLFQKSEKNVPLDSNIKLGIVRQEALTIESYTDVFRNSEVYYFKSDSDCLEALERGKIEYAYLDENSATQELRRQYYPVEILPSYTMQSGYAIAVNNDSVRLGRIIDKCIKTFDKEMFNKTLLKYSVENHPFAFKRLLKQYRVQVLLVILFVIILVYFLYMFAANKKYFNVQLESRNHDLQEANDKLKDALMSKSDFLSNMSHEIRTPMNAIIGMTHLAENEIKSSNVNEDILNGYLEDIEHSSVYLLGIINDILDMNKIESGKVSFNKEWIDIDEVINSVVKMMIPQITEKEIKFEYADNSEKIKDIEFFTDKTRLKQIIMNLLSNAYKFTECKGTILFEKKWEEVDESTMRLTMVVRDNGCGMSEKFLEIVFEPFAQERNKYSDVYAGTGLGLALSKQIINELGGTIEVQSKLSVGSSFTVVIPFEYRVAENKKEEVTDELDESQLDSILEDKTILLVEDQELNRKIATKLLLEKKMNIISAINGEEAVKIFTESPDNTIDAILMDLRMPVMDGYEATRRIRASYKADALSVPIIAMTANAFSEDVEACLKVGMNTHLAKPIFPNILYRTLAEKIKNRDRS